MKEYRNPRDVHQPVAAYTHQIEVKGPESLLVLSGQIGMKQDGSVPFDPAEQLEVALDNVILNLKDAGMNVGDLLKLNFFLVGEMDAAKRRAVIESKLGKCRPCTTLVFVAGLANPSLKVEIDAWASREE